MTKSAGNYNKENCGFGYGKLNFLGIVNDHETYNYQDNIDPSLYECDEEDKELPVTNGDLCSVSIHT